MPQVDHLTYFPQVFWIILTYPFLYGKIISTAFLSLFVIFLLRSIKKKNSSQIFENLFFQKSLEIVYLTFHFFNSYVIPSFLSKYNQSFLSSLTNFFFVSVLDTKIYALKYNWYLIIKKNLIV